MTIQQESIRNYLSNKLGKEVVHYETDWWAGCDTCDFGTGEIHVRFEDGTTDHFSEQFGTVLNEIIEYADQELTGKIGYPSRNYWTDNLNRFFE